MGRRGGRNKRRFDGLLAVGFMAALVVWVSIPHAKHAADRHRAVLETAALGVLVLVVAGLAVWWVRRWWARTQAQVRAACGARAMWAASAALHALTPAQFEAALGELLQNGGCTRVRVVGGSGDQGADVIGCTPDGRRLVVQAKRYAPGRAVGAPDVQRFGGTCFVVHAADIAVVITTAGRFTEAARSYARTAGIRLMDGGQLVAWRDGAGPPPWA